MVLKPSSVEPLKQWPRGSSLENVTDAVMKTEGDVVLLEALVTVTARPAKFQLMISHSETKTKVLLTRIIDHYLL